MKPRSNVQLSQNHVTEDLPSGNIAELLLQWENSESVSAELAAREVSQPPPPAFANLANDTQSELSSELAREQIALLTRLTSVQAGSLADIRAKLRIWMSLTCPSDSDAHALSLADRLVVSAFNDLQRLDV